MIPFNVPPFLGQEMQYIEKAISNHKICGDGEFTSKCSQWIEEKFKCPKVLITTSCTHALEMAALLCGIDKDDEVIMPSFTFVSTANAFVQRGAKIVFVDIRPDTMNIDESKIEAAITSKTRAIVPVHYAGIACDMDYIGAIAKKYGLYIIEDAAQGVMSYYNNRALGTLGNFGCYSFHETKNYSMGEGGAILINEAKYIEQAEIIREKGTNRSRFWRGQIDKYTWIDYGSSYLPSELNTAYLFAQLERAGEINIKRLAIWNIYYDSFREDVRQNAFELPSVPKQSVHNAHMFYIKVKDLEDRTRMIDFLSRKGIMAPFHYVPLHSSPAGLRFGCFNGKDDYTTRESNRLIRLPLYYDLDHESQAVVINAVKEYLNKGR